MKPSILVLTSTLPRAQNDNEPRFVADLCTELSKKFRVTILTQHRPGSATRETTEEFEIVRFRYAPCSLELLSENGGITSSLKKNRLLWLLIPTFVFFQVLAIRKLLKSHKYSVIHAHWLIPQGLAATFAKLTVSNSPPIICTGHGADIFGLQGKVLSKLKRWIIDHSAAVTVVSQSMKSYLQSELKVRPEKIKVIPMGTDLSNIFTPKEGMRNLGQIAFVGRLVEKKGLKYLIQVIPSLVTKLEKLNLIIAGSGPERAELEELVSNLNIEGNVTFVGAKNHREIADLYRSSEACIFPFVKASDGDMEGFGLVTVEAMGCKCPVIVGDIPAVRDIVQDGKTGLICKPTDPEILTTTILRVLRSKDTSAELANAAYQFVQQNFSWEKIGDRYTQLIFEILTTHENNS